MNENDGDFVTSEPAAAGSDGGPAGQRGGSQRGVADTTAATPVTGAAAGRTSRRTAKKRPFWIELPILIVIAFGLTFLIQTFVAKVYYVPSGSMEQTLHGVANGGDRILANKIVYDFRDPKQGDVVVL